MEKYDFCGWATKNNLKCSDGRIIRKDAFKHNDGCKVPLVWNHDHTDPYRVIGHALLENREEGVYAYGYLNSTDLANTARIYLEHGDITQMSIYANSLKEQGPNVMHGNIREVSLVLASANPGASIENVIKHSDDGEPVVTDEGYIITGEDICLYRADTDDKEPKKDEESNDKTVQEVLDTYNEEQKAVLYAVVSTLLDDEDDKTEENNDIKHSEGGNDTMKRNLFDQDTKQENNTLSHSDLTDILNKAKRNSSLKDEFLAHTDYAEGDQDYGIIGTDWLFPEDHNLNSTPEFIKRDTGWVSKVMTAVHHTPFSRIKSVFADITEDEARAKGYIKGKLKKEEVFSLLKRSTSPTTIYKKQKLDRDDVSDITDFDVVAWIKREMRLMLDEEIARAVLVGDGRLGSSDDKISEDHIRPVWKDEDLFTVKALVEVAADGNRAKEFIKTVVKSRKNYKGSGNPTLYTTEDVLTECLLLEDNNGRIIYDSIEKLKSILRVTDIVTVPVMEGLSREADGNTRNLMGLIVNLKDYNVGADKGGAINMFDDFDIDFNAQKYLIETRCSGALVKPFAAIAIEELANQ